MFEIPHLRAVSLLAVSALLLAGCASVGIDGVARWERELERRGLDAEALPHPFVYSEEMADAARTAAGTGTEYERLVRLQRFLFDDVRFPFEYEADGTYSAEEAFHLRRGNCVAITSLFVAMGRSLGIPLYAALVSSGESEREGEMVVINNHLVAAHPDGTRITFFDFAERRERPLDDVRVIDDLWVAAIHLNNRGIEQLRAGRPEEAAKLLSAAVALAPGFVAPYGNLGVARRRAGDPQGALDTYRRALEVAPGDPTVVNNLASLYSSLGRPDEAASALESAKLRDASPFVLVARGDLELARGNAKEARRLYRRARRAGPELVAPHLGLARAELELGRENAARRALAMALDLEPGHAEAKRLAMRLARR